MHLAAVVVIISKDQHATGVVAGGRAVEVRPRAVATVAGAAAAAPSSAAVATAEHHVVAVAVAAIVHGGDAAQVQLRGEVSRGRAGDDVGQVWSAAAVRGGSGGGCRGGGGSATAGRLMLLLLLAGLGTAADLKQFKRDC